MLKTFQYRLYPTKRQSRVLTEHLEECRWLWNTLIAERKQAWDERHESLTYTDQQNTLPAMKRTVRPSLAGGHALVVQDVAHRLDDAFAHFFRRLKQGETPGYPRFKGAGRYASLTYAQWDNGVHLTANGKRIYLSKIGDVKLVYHRPLEGMPKTATIKRTATGKWFVTITCEWEQTPLPPTGQEAGIDVGLHTFATASDGTTIENPRFFRTEQHALARAQRHHQGAVDAHKVRRSEAEQRVEQEQPERSTKEVAALVKQDPQVETAWHERRKQRKVVARIHERTAWRRTNFAHQQSRRLVNQYDLLVIEDLIITNMVKNPTLAKSIHDAAWGQMAELIACKAAWASRGFIAINPAYTSTDCSRCGQRKTDLTLADRVYHCLGCGLVIDRDLNAARNILARGRACLGLP